MIINTFSSKRGGRWLPMSVFVAGIVSSPMWGAATLTLPGNPPGNIVTTIYQANCLDRTATNVLAPVCSDKAFISNALATDATTFNYISPQTFNGALPTNQTFTSAFNNWNNARPVAQQWTLVNGGQLDATINVTTFQPVVAPVLGGLNVQAGLTLNYAPAGTTALPNLNQLVWTQALYLNYQPGNPANLNNNPPNTLDSATFNNFLPCQALPASPNNTTPSTIPTNNFPAGVGSYCDPIYPTQGQPGNLASAAGFIDTPRGFWDRPASFRGIALLSSVNTATRTLTVYNDGIAYGFDLALPEPALLLPLFLLCCLLLLGARNRRLRATN